MLSMRTSAHCSRDRCVSSLIRSSSRAERWGAANLAEPASERSGPSRDGTIQERVLRLLADSEGPMRATDIVKSTGGKRPSVFAVLSQLHKFGVIRRVSHGMYEAVKP